MEVGDTMRVRAWWILLGCLALFAPAAAQDDKSWSGSVDLGYRSVSVDGNEDAYRTDVNLSDGLRLFNFDYSYQPLESGILDDLEMYATGVGGDPYTAGGLRLRKTGRYDLSLGYRSSVYFYRDDGFFFSPQGDLHSWDARREFADLSLKIQATKWLRLRLGADRMERTGASTTTRDVQSNVFVLARPVDQQASSYWLGADFRFGWADLTLEQRARSYENRWLMTTSSATGVGPGSSVLDDYRQLQVQDGDSPVSRVVFAGAPLERLRFSLGYSRIDSEMKYDVQGDWDGLDGTAAPYQTVLANNGTVQRDSDLLDFEVIYGITPRLDLAFDYRRRSYDQTGTIDYLEQQTGGAGDGDYVVQGSLPYKLDLDMAGLTVDWRLKKAWSLMGGVGLQTRDADMALSGPPVETQRRFLRAGVGYRPGPKLDFSLKLENTEDEDPYTPVSPTDIQRVVLRGRVLPGKDVTIGFHVKDESRENLLSYPLSVPTDDTPPATEISTAVFDVRSWGFLVGWGIDPVDLSLGYTRTEISSNADIVYITGFAFTPILDVDTTLNQTGYIADQDSVQLSAKFRWAKRWSAGLLAAYTSNAGSFPMDWQHYRGDLRYEFGSGLFLRVQYDHFRRDEDNPYAGIPASPEPGINNFNADLWVGAVGYRF
jgi:hypothetical protein